MDRSKLLRAMRHTFIFNCRFGEPTAYLNLTYYDSLALVGGGNLVNIRPFNENLMRFLVVYLKFWYFNLSLTGKVENTLLYLLSRQYSCLPLVRQDIAFKSTYMLTQLRDIPDSEQ